MKVREQTTEGERERAKERGQRREGGVTAAAAGMREELKAKGGGRQSDHELNERVRSMWRERERGRERERERERVE